MHLGNALKSDGMVRDRQGTACVTHVVVALSMAGVERDIPGWDCVQYLMAGGCQTSEHWLFQGVR